MKKLYNISNHPSKNWEEKQKEGFDQIIDIEHPNIPPDYTLNQVLKEFVMPILQILEKEEDKLNIMIQGEYTFVFLLLKYLNLFEKNKNRNIDIYIPTTERKVVETQKDTGEVVKVSVFKFVKWRIIDWWL